MVDDKFRKILNINLTEEQIGKVKNYIEENKKEKNGIDKNNNKNITQNPCGTVYKVCFKKAEKSYYEGLKLHTSFIYYIIQNFVFLISFTGKINTQFLDKSIAPIYLIVYLVLCAVYIFWKLFYKKYDENFTEKKGWIYFHLFNLFIFKAFMYYFLYLILLYTIQAESPVKIFIWFFTIKNTFLIYCAVYLFARNGLISYATLTIFGIVILIISTLFSMITLNLKDVLIQFIMGVVGMLFFHLGIILARYKEALFENKNSWNTLSIEVFELTLILFPALIGAITTLLFVTFGLFISFLR